MIGLYSYDAWKCTPPPDDTPDYEAKDEWYLLECEQDEYERAAAECDERAPWPGDPERPFQAQRERAKVGGAR